MELAETTEGQRNDQLNRAAFAVGQLVGGGEVDELEAVNALMGAARRCGLDEIEISKTLSSGMEAGKQDPRSAPPPQSPSVPRRPIERRPPGDPPDDGELDAFGPGDDDTAPASAAEHAEEPGTSIADVLSRWSADGPLVHEPTGIRQLDDLTGGGPVYGTRWYVAGAPDGWKTGLLAQLGHVWALREIEIGALAVDEEDSDLVTRLAQRCGYDRIDCEIRDPATLTTMAENFGALPVRFYTTTIDAAAAATAARAERVGRRGALLVDSIQTVTCDAVELAMLGGRELSEVQRVTLNTRALRAVATRYKLICIATSEMGRGAYASGDPEKQTSTMAAGKWSGAIEYSARVLLGVRCVADQSDMIELEVAKNKHGPSGRRMYLRTDRRSQTIIETDYQPEPEQKQGEKDAVKRGRTRGDAAVVARVLLAQPGLGIVKLRGAVEADSGMGHGRVDTALALLGAAVVEGKGARGAKPMSINREAVPAEILALMGGTNA